MEAARSTDDLRQLQREAFDYFLKEVNPANGLILDKTAENWPSSIAATGLALACYPVAVENGLMSRSGAVARTLATLRFFSSSPQGPEPDATGYKGFYYHFLDMASGRRAWQCELSTIDSALLLAGALSAAAYFDLADAREREISEIATPYGWWVSPWHFGLNQGPIVLMIENHWSGLLWRLMRTCPYVLTGLRRAGFDGGWLEVK
ncbi:hypothetical protein ILFOPFJJ_05729 [Ensifer psoraleae]|uniref:glucoamylase family protein n=1 Tax=Sinorhizobium psoraleae TaxID=520838 RepID=UPI0015687B39|nr:glucoamylase family protein [Sinorhizobium psoraleae]NRP74807.1 hypothetical protein [Sinorhizobium psoraleae]